MNRQAAQSHDEFPDSAAAPVVPVRTQSMLPDFKARMMGAIWAGDSAATGREPADDWPLELRRSLAASDPLSATAGERRAVGATACSDVSASGLAAESRNGGWSTAAVSRDSAPGSAPSLGAPTCPAAEPRTLDVSPECLAAAAAAIGTAGTTTGGVTRRHALSLYRHPRAPARHPAWRPETVPGLAMSAALGTIESAIVTAMAALNAAGSHASSGERAAAHVGQSGRPWLLIGNM